MKKRRDDPEILAAYVLGDLDPAERKDFELRLKEDSHLQRECEEYRATLGALEDWMRNPLSIPEDSTAPPMAFPLGSHREFRHPPGGPALVRSIIQLAAAMALFLGGYWFGQTTASPPAFSPLIGDEPAPPIQYTAPTALETPVPTPLPREEQGSRYALDSPRTRSFEQDGKLIVETKLSRSDSTAVWIVNGDFGLEN